MTIKKHIGWYLVFMLLFSNHLCAQIQFTEYKTEDGLPHDFTFQMYQDKDGYLWIGTDDGLAKYNGKEFEVFNLSDGFRTNYIVDVKKYNKDTMALAVYKGGLHFMVNDSVFKPDIKDDEISRIDNLAILGNDIFTVGNDGIYLYYERKNDLEFKREILALSKDTYGDVKFDNQGFGKDIYSRGKIVDSTYYFFKGPFVCPHPRCLKGIYKYVSKEETVLVFPFLKEKYISLFERYDEHTYFATEKDHFFIFNKDSIIREIKHDFNGGTINKYKRTSSFEIFSVSERKTGNDLIYIYDKNNDNWQLFSDQIDASFLVSGILVDKDENIWITTNASGLYKIMNTTNIVKETLLKEDSIIDIAIGQEDEVFFLKYKSIYGYNFKTKNLSPVVFDYHVTRFMQNELCTNVIPLQFVGDEEKKQVIDYDFVKSILFQRQKGKYTFSYVGAFLSKTDLQTDEVVSIFVNNRDNIVINDIAFFKDEVWVATNNGIYIYDFDSLACLRHLKTNEGLKKLYIKKLASFSDKGVWCATSDGVSLIKANNEIVHYGEKEGLASTRINNIFLDHRDVLWVATQKGFSILKDEMFYNFGNKQGFISSYASTVIEDRNHQIWVAGNKGVARIDNTKPFSPITPPRLIAKQEKSNFNLDIIDYSEIPVLTEYRSNTTNAWVPIESNIINTQNYAPGKHYLQFRARNLNSNWKYSKEHYFTIPQVWYRNIWVIISTSLLVVTIITILVYSQLLKVSRRNVLLRDTIAQSTKLEKELSTVRENVAQDFHDELGNKLAGISVLSELIMKDKEIQNSKSIEMVSQVRKDAKDLYFGIKDFVWSIDSKSDNLNELLFYLTDFGEELFQNKGITFKIEKNQIEKDIKLPYYWSRQLLLMFKEIMTNSLKHADATQVTLSFYKIENTLKITFTDNGKGFDINNLKRKNGLNNIHKRAHRIGGKLTIKSIPGTSIEFLGDLG
ncbi:two-component regulator propeller domain-containing protein [Aquimarina sp. 2201CG1-2-11]|uniref:ligand-binding sensor domain-containing protein n=1 Tax=Aquimarina discodermiae TaxID=3231043 RepID=UPI00346222A9